MAAPPNECCNIPFFHNQMLIKMTLRTLPMKLKIQLQLRYLREDIWVLWQLTTGAGSKLHKLWFRYLT